MSKLENAQKVVEFAKANGFPDADIYVYDIDAEAGYTDLDEAVQDLAPGVGKKFRLGLDLSDIELCRKVEKDPLEEGDDLNVTTEVG